MRTLGRRFAEASFTPKWNCGCLDVSFQEVVHSEPTGETGIAKFHIHGKSHSRSATLDQPLLIKFCPLPRGTI